MFASLTYCAYFSKGGEIRDTKTLNFSRNSLAFQVLVYVSRFSPSSPKFIDNVRAFVSRIK